METATKNKWKSSAIDQHCKNQHNNGEYGSRRRYGSSLYDCPCCISLSGWKRAKKKCIKYDVNVQQKNSRNDSDIFINDMNEMNDDIEYIAKWQCTQCTFINLNSTPFCSVCNKPFDYNYQNNLHYKQQQTVIIQYKSSKKKNKNKRKTIIQNNNKKQLINIETDILLSKDENYMVEAEKYRLCKNSKTQKQKYSKQQCSKQPRSKEAKKECFELFDIETSVITTICNEYEYVEEKLYDDWKQQSFWINVPMKLINTKLQQCSFKILHKNKEKAKYLYFQPKVSDFFVPIYLTKYLFIYKHDSIPKLLENRCLFKIIKHCLNQCYIQSIKFNHNLSTISFNLEAMLFEYIPSKDILNNLLFPFIGYNQALCIKANVKNVKIDTKLFKLYSNDDEINTIDNRYNSALHHILIKTKKQPHHNKVVDDNSDTSQHSIPLFFKHLNDNDDTDNSSETTKKAENVKNTEDNEGEHVLFKPPYKYGRYSYLNDDDDDRDTKWWNTVKYEKGKRKSDKSIQTVYDRKRQSYSKSNTIRYFGKSGR